MKIDTPPAAPLAELRSVRKTFPKASGGDLLVLDGIDLRLMPGEIVCLLGRSGSGKSTLLRILAGLLPPTTGEVCFRGEPLRGPSARIAMVFQSFALFPWLTVLGNVELGLEAQGLPAAELRSRALEAIDLIGLDGFESAYPKELSGGMRQRVGFARALVTHPALLLMDEAFSALDVLTAETLRAEFLSLWSERKLPIDSVLMVTHNIEEAALMGDRIVLLGTHPGRIVDTLEVTLPRPRDRFDPEFRGLVDLIYSKMTQTPIPTAAVPIAEVLPVASTNMLAGLLETVAGPPFDGSADLPVLETHLRLEGKEFLPLADAARRLGFVQLAAGDIHLTAEGTRFVAATDVDDRKALFANQLLRHVPLARHIFSVLEARPGKRAPKARFQQELEDHLSVDDAQTTLESVIHWGRFAELFAYDDQAEEFSLDNP